MKETESYIKFHDFLSDTLELPEIPRRVFAVIFTVSSSAESKGVWGSSFIARKAHISVRSVKQGICCLTGIGIINKAGVSLRGAYRYSTVADKCGSTTEAKEKLARDIHRCDVFTNAQDSHPRCKRCPFGGEYHAHQILKEDINDKNKLMKEKKDGISGNRRSYAEPPDVFIGSDTL